jgi:hypothetical protein
MSLLGRKCKSCGAEATDEQRAANGLRLFTAIDSMRELQSAVVTDGTPKLFLIHAEWCGHCTRFKVMADKYTAGRPHGVKLYSIDGDLLGTDANSMDVSMVFHTLGVPVPRQLGFPTVVTHSMRPVDNKKQLLREISGKDASPTDMFQEFVAMYKK